MKYTPKEDRENFNVPPTKMKTDVVFLLGGALVIILLIILSLGWAGEYVAAKIPVDQEVKWFRRLSDGDFSKHFDEPRIEYLMNSLNSDLAKELKVVLICDETPNAFAIPGGILGFTTGLLRTLYTENGLAFVIGHEMGHFVNRHHLKTVGRALGFALAGQIIGFSSDGSFTGKVLESLLSNAYSREQEMEADNYAISLVEKVYGHLRASDEFFERILSSSEGKLLEKIPGVLKTHPQTKERFERIKQKINFENKAGAIVEFHLSEEALDSHCNKISTFDF